jgi:hypothetical protein
MGVSMSTNENKRALEALAEGQGGLFLASQAVTLGYKTANHKYHLNAGNWEKVSRGIFRLVRSSIAENEDLIAISLWSIGRKGDDPKVIFVGTTALSLAQVGDQNHEHINGIVPEAFRRHSDPPFKCTLAVGHVPDEAIHWKGVVAFANPVWVSVQMLQRNEISQPEAAQIVRQALIRGFATETKAEKWGAGSLLKGTWEGEGSARKS